jgi:hypothetical protein
LRINFKGCPLVKDVRAQCLFDQNIEIIDLKVDVHGPIEDHYYAVLPELLKNIRRGNTLIKIRSGDQF